MGTRESTADRRRDLERLLTFVDAIVAIAITLLVLPLVELTARTTEDDSVATLLHQHQAQFWSFLLSFAVIARLWFAQHRAVQHLVKSHRQVSMLLMLWTLTIVFLPFPTVLVATTGHQAATKVLYIGTILLSSVAVGLIARVLQQNPGLSDGDGLPSAAPAFVSAGLLVLALVLSLATPATSYYPLLLLLLEAPLRRLRQRFRPQPV